MKHLNITALFLLILLGSCVSKANKEDQVEPAIVEEILLDSVWAANGVGFDLQTVGEFQFVAYFDKNRMMTVASRQVGSDIWMRKTLDNQLMWDSHNYVTLGVDKAGYIHVSGNMHVHPLAYFRSNKPYDVTSMVAVNSMVGENEQRVTYPSFYYDKAGELYYSYRCGSCGDGNIIVNRFDTEKGEWERYLDQSLFEGVELNENRAAYHQKMKDADGNLHFVWLWRWTPDVETCHNMCYATTSDMKNWKNAAGEKVSLPFRPEDRSVSVDPTPSKGGMHNSRFRMILTKKAEPIIAYVKYDEEGNTQFYLAKFTNEAWLVKQISDWDFRWKFIDGGAFMSKGGTFKLAGISDDGLLAVDWTTETGQQGRYTIDVETLEHSDRLAIIKKKYPSNIGEKLTVHPDMNVRMAYDKAGVYKDGSKYILKWEAKHGGFRQHAPEVIPQGPLSPLKLIRIE